MAGLSTADDRALGTTVRVVVTEGEHLAAAKAAVDEVLHDIDLACSRFRDDSELARLNRAAGTEVVVGPLLGRAIDEGLRAARLTGGDVDPTVGTAIRLAGYDVDFAEVAAEGGPLTLLVQPIPGWRAVRYDPGLPPGLRTRRRRDRPRRHRQGARRRPRRGRRARGDGHRRDPRQPRRRHRPRRSPAGRRLDDPISDDSNDPVEVRDREHRSPGRRRRQLEHAGCGAGGAAGRAPPHHRPTHRLPRARRPGGWRRSSPTPASTPTSPPPRRSSGVRPRSSGSAPCACRRGSSTATEGWCAPAAGRPRPETGG